MLLHTIIPPEQVLYSQEQSPEYVYQNVGKMVLQGTEDNGIFTISRLISTDPKSYLNPRFSPGQPYRKNLNQSTQ